MSNKVCRGCNIAKLPNEFYPNGNFCKECVKTKSRLYALNNPEKVKDYKRRSGKRYVVSDEKRDQYNANRRSRYSIDSAKIKASNKKYYNSNKDRFKYDPKYYLKNKESRAEIQRKYNSKSRDKSKIRKKKYIEQLWGGYIKDKLRRKGFSQNDIKNHPELLELQKISIELNREIKNQTK